MWHVFTIITYYQDNWKNVKNEKNGKKIYTDIILKSNMYISDETWCMFIRDEEGGIKV